MRTAESLGRIYAQSGLATAYKSPETTTHEDFVPVTVWLLEKATPETAVPKTQTEEEEDEDYSLDSNGHFKNLAWTEKEERLRREIHNPLQQ